MTHAEMSNAELAYRLRGSTSGRAAMSARAGRLLAVAFVVVFWTIVIWGLL